MPLLKWKPEYTVHEAELDNHHITLFNILNSAYETVMNSSEVNSFISVVDEMSEQIKYHFITEEQLMQEKEIPGIEAHIAEHRLFADKIEALKMNTYENNLEAAKELIIVLGIWVLRHILIEDRKCSSLPSQEEYIRPRV